MADTNLPGPIGSPSPDDGAAAPGGNSEGRRKHTKNPRAVLSVQECLEALSQLLLLVASNLMSPQRANTIRSAIETMLRHHRATASSAAATLPTEAVHRILQLDPELLGVFAPHLSEEQLREITERYKVE